MVLHPGMGTSINDVRFQGRSKMTPKIVPYKVKIVGHGRQEQVGQKSLKIDGRLLMFPIHSSGNKTFKSRSKIQHALSKRVQSRACDRVSSMLAQKRAGGVRRQVVRYSLRPLHQAITLEIGPDCKELSTRQHKKKVTLARMFTLTNNQISCNY